MDAISSFGGRAGQHQFRTLLMSDGDYRVSVWQVCAYHVRSFRFTLYACAVVMRWRIAGV
jgi:hypothetical protein